jgi:hypothetical protein
MWMALGMSVRMPLNQLSAISAVAIIPCSMMTTGYGFDGL